jgi:hypothetical protein
MITRGELEGTLVFTSGKDRKKTWWVIKQEEETQSKVTYSHIVRTSGENYDWLCFPDKVLGWDKAYLKYKTVDENKITSSYLVYFSDDPKNKEVESIFFSYKLKEALDFISNDQALKK